jgi:hypothetical protein
MPPLVIPYAPSQIYQPNGRLVDLLRLQGDQAAEGQRRLGEIQASMWGNLGNQITQTGANLVRAQQEAPINALNKAKVQDALDLRKGQQVIDSALQPVQPQGPVEEGQPPMQASHPYLSDDGLVDPTKVTALLNANGMGHLAPDLLKGIEAQNSSIAAYKDHQQETATKQTVMLGSVANTTLGLMKAGLPFQDAAAHASSSLVATGVLPPDVVQKQIQQLAALPPDQQIAGLQQLKATAARLGPTKTLSDGAKEVDIFGDTVADNPKNEKPHPVEKASFGLKMADGTVQNAEGFFNPNANGGKGGYFVAGPDGSQQDVSARVVKNEAAPELTPEQRLVNGKPTDVIFHKTGALAGNYTLPGKTDIVQTSPIPPASLVLRDAPVPQVTLNAHEEGIAKDLASGKMTMSDFSRMYSSRSGQGQAVKEALYSRARELNPDFSPAQFEAGYKLATNPQVAQRVVAINALAPVVDKITALAQQAGNTDLPTFNKLLMEAKFQVGDKTITNLRQLQTLLGDEAGLALGVGQASDLKTKLGLDLVNPSLSPSNFADTMQQLQSILGSRRDTLLKGMGVYGGGPAVVPIAQPPSVPSNVSAALKGQAPGIHTLSDGSKWMIDANGAITKQ